ESKNLKERSCTSASSAERLGPSAMASVYVPGGSAAGTTPNIGQECGHEPAGAHTEPLGRRSTNAPLPRAAPARTFVHQGPVAPKSGGRSRRMQTVGTHRARGSRGLSGGAPSISRCKVPPTLADQMSLPDNQA